MTEPCDTSDRFGPPRFVLLAVALGAMFVGVAWYLDRGRAFPDADGLTAAEHEMLHATPDIDPLAECVCDPAELRGGWCRAHGFGFIAGRKVTDWMVFDAVDAHGHDIRVETLTCPQCIAALETDGFCAEHRMGFVAERAFFSPLTHVLALGQSPEAGMIGCAVCRANARDEGWCDDCAIGMIGNVAFEDRALWQSARQPWASLGAADALETTCPACRPAAALDTTCPLCFTVYRDGRPTE